MKRTLLFDFDGVIVDSFAPAFEASKMICPHTTEEDYQRFFEGNINDAVNIPVVHTEDCRRDIDFFEAYIPKMQHVPLVGGMDEVIKTLAEAYRLVIISSTISAPIRELLERFHLEKYFDQFLGNDIHQRKTEKIQMIFDQYAHHPSECVFITDTLGDLREAKEKGVGAIAVSWGFHSRETLQKESPFRIVDTPKELIDAVGDYFGQTA